MTQDISSNLGVVRGGRNRQSERRVITVLFCDVVGSTALAEQLDPEEWTEIMNEAFGYLTGPIYRYEGTVARLMGDAILAFFGAPFAHEDDPQRAILAGLDIISGIGSFREEIKAEYGLDFNVRVGINTGAVVVGDVGSAQAGEYTAMGDAVNLAARMEQTAAPGTVQIAEDTHELVAPLFDFEALGGIEVKGKSEPVSAYRVLAPKDDPGRLRGIEGFSAPLVGRSKEMDTLRQTITELREGRGQIICLIGEAGLGKTRLIDELRAEWERAVDEESYPDTSWLESRGISYDSNRPYGLFLDRLRKFLDFEESDAPEAIHEKIVKGTENLPSDHREPVIAALDTLFASRRANDDTQVGGEILKRELFDSLHHAWADMASEAPRVRVFDDMHWADPASVELLIHMFHIAEESPFLFICSFRPERQSPAWKIKQAAETDYPHRYTEITLRPLNVNDSDTLVDSLLDSSGVPNQVHQLVQTKAEGNPFFVEEIVRSLIDGGAFTRDEDSSHLHSTGDIQDFTIPDNLQALLTSRIDRLETEARRTLQLASVIGRSFNYNVLKSILSAPDTLERQLSTLQRMELIRETSRVPERVYSFNHELSREAAYNSILRRQRREYHRKVGDTIEALFPDKFEDNAHRLAYHFDEGRNAERAVKYYMMAGDAAAYLYAHSEAIADYSRAIDLTDRVEVDNEQLIIMYNKLGRALELSGDYAEALKRYQALESLARHRNDGALELASLMPQATIRSTYNNQFDPEQGQSLSIRSLALARNLNDPQAQAKVLWNLMLLEVYSGRDSERAITFGEQSIAIAREHNVREQLAYSLNDIARAYSQVGRRQDGRAALQEATELWRELNDLPMLSDALLSMANDYNDTGEFDKATVLAEEALEISDRSDNSWGQALGKFTMSIICIERGEIGKGRASFEDAVPFAEQGSFAGAGTIIQAYAGWIFGIFVGDLDRGLQMTWNALSACEDRPDYRPFVLAVLAHLRLFTEGPSEASKLMDEAREDSKKVGMDLESGFMNMFMVFYRAIESEIAIANHEYERALEAAEKTLANMNRLGTSLHKPDILRLKGQALVGLERLDEGRDALMEASAIAEAQISRRSIWRILYALSQLEAMQGNLEQAEIYRVQAREIIFFISESAGSTQGRAFFLNFPPVREVMNVE